MRESLSLALVVFAPFVLKHNREIANRLSRLRRNDWASGTQDLSLLLPGVEKVG
jgi:hypothetical protein